MSTSARREAVALLCRERRLHSLDVRLTPRLRRGLAEAVRRQEAVACQDWHYPNPRHCWVLPGGEIPDNWIPLPRPPQPVLGA